MLCLGSGRQQLWLRAEREVPAAVCPRRPQHWLTGPVGDRGVQVAASFTQRSSLQAHLRHFHRLQEHRFQDCQRAEAVTTTGRLVPSRGLCRVNRQPSRVYTIEWKIVVARLSISRAVEQEDSLARCFVRYLCFPSCVQAPIALLTSSRSNLLFFLAPVFRL